MTRVLMTPAGFQKLREELKRYRHVERPANIKAIEAAIAHGDLSENAEYDAAKERQAFIEGKLQEIEGKLAVAEVIEPSSIKADRVAFGATVRLLDIDTDEELSYQIVGVDETDVKGGKISYLSPIAKALMGKREEDEVRVDVPKGVREFEITKIEFI